MPTIRFLDFLLLNAILIFSSFLIFSLLYREKTASAGKLFLCITTLFFSEIIIIEILLGSFSILNYKNLAITISFLFIILLWLVLYKKIKTPQIEKPKKIPKIFTLLLFGPLTILLLTRLGNVLLEIPMEYDSLAYHLPFVAKWLQTSSIIQPYFTAFAGPIGYYPSNFELVTLFTVLPLHNDFLSTLINFFLYLPIAICLFLIFRNFEIRKKLSLALTASLLYMPVFVNQVGTQLTDLFFTLTFLLSIYFIQENHKKFSKLNSLLFGLSIGLFLGTKYLAIPYAIIPITIFIILNFKIKKILPFVLGAFITGSFFYLRNLFFTGNPIFPAEVKIFGLEIFEGFGNLAEQFKNSSLLANLNIETFKKVFIATFQNMGYQGILIRLFLPITLLFLIFKKFQHKKLSTKNRLLTLTFLSTIFFAFIYISSPNTNIHILQNTRYAIPVFVAATMTTGIFISKFKKLRLSFLLLLIFPTFYTLFSFNSLEADEFDYTKIFETSYLRRYGENPKIRSLMEATDWLNQNTNKTKIAYTGFNLHYHLYGRNLKREVDYININECGDCDYFDFKNSPDGIRSSPDFTAWLKNLRAKNKEYLVIDTEPESQVEMYELDWAKQYSKIFQSVFDQGSFIIYQIDQTKAGALPPPIVAPPNR